MKKTIAILASCGISLLPIMSIAAVTVLDPVPSPDPAGLTDDNRAAAELYCNGLATSLDTDGPSEASDRYVAEVDEGTPTLVGSPAEVGTEEDRIVVGNKTPTADAIFTPNAPHIVSNPFRNGGSVNMWAIQASGGGTWSASVYNFKADFAIKYAHPYTCNVSFEKYIPEHDVVTPPDPNGYYEKAEGAPGNGANCEAHNANHPSWWGFELLHDHCVFVGTLGSIEHVGEDWASPIVTNHPGGSFEQTQIAQLLAHEDHGGPFETQDDIMRKVLACISPSTSSKKTATNGWAMKNGYNGGSLTGPGAGCNTTWYNNGAGTGVSNLNVDSHNWSTLPEA